MELLGLNELMAEIQYKIHMWYNSCDTVVKLVTKETGIFYLYCDRLYCFNTHFQQ